MTLLLRVRKLPNWTISAAQIGTGYLLSPEAKVSPVHRQLLRKIREDVTVTYVFTGRPGRGPSDPSPF
jgi:NAD(P)H-dependent flavin oxidoreductase YrpB (nitropropane dioxygenase family)